MAFFFIHNFCISKVGFQTSGRGEKIRQKVLGRCFKLRVAKIHSQLEAYTTADPSWGPHLFQGFIFLVFQTQPC